MNRRIIISEDERSRILGLHENRKRQEWNLIFEQDNTGCASVPELKNIEDEKKFRGWVKQNYGKEKITVAGTTKAPNDQVSPGRDFIVASPNQFCTSITPGIWGAKPASGGGKTLGELYLAANPTTPAGPDVKTTFVVNGQKKTYATPEEITAAFQSGELNGDTQVWNPTANLTGWTKIKDLPADNPLSLQFKPIMAQVAPEYKESFTIKIIGADGKQVDMDNATIEKGIMDKSITTETPALDPKTNTWSKAGQIETLKPIFAKVVPEYKAPQTEMPSTGNKTLDEWLKTPSGQTYLSKPDRPSQEAYIDYLEQSGDPIIAAVGGKKALRQILLGDVNKDTRFGRWLQKGMNKVRNVGDVLVGKDVVANKGYNPNTSNQTTGGGGTSNPTTTNQTTFSPEEQKKFMDMASQMKLPQR